MLEDIGYEPVIAPVIGIEAPADGGAALRAAFASTADIAWVVFTSPNAASAAAGVIDSDTRADLRVAVVGPGTGVAAAEAGFTVTFVAERNVAEGVLEAFASLPVFASQRIVVPQAQRARPALVAGLRTLGWTVDAPVAYTTVAVGLSEAQVSNVRGADAVAFTSASTVEALLLSVAPEDLPAVLVSIGPETSAAMRRNGLKPTAEASPHTLVGLVDVIGLTVPGR
jgi:uroporphyrinogen-III synthase